jgi:hypothetical protein
LGQAEMEQQTAGWKRLVEGVGLILDMAEGERS